MCKAIKLSVIMFLLFSFVRTNAQTASIELILFPSLSSIDFAAFSFEKQLTNQPRIMQVIIAPPGIDVYVEGNIQWKKNEISGFQTIGSFTTELFKARTFYNDEIDASDIKIKTSNYNSDLTKENLELGKPSGLYTIALSLYNAQGNFLGSSAKELSFLNPTPPQIILPMQNSSQDVGSIMVQWTQSQGVSSYKILANFIADNQTNYEQALNAGNPVVNNRDVGNVTLVNLRDILDREVLSDTNIVLVVKGIVQRPGGEDELKSAPVVFSTGTAGSTSASYSVSPPNAELVRLANLISGQVNQEFITKILTGQIQAEEVQISDENGNTLSFSEFINVLNYLEQNNDAIITVNFTSK